MGPKKYKVYDPATKKSKSNHSHDQHSEHKIV